MYEPDRRPCHSLCVRIRDPRPPGEPDEPDDEVEPGPVTIRRPAEPVRSVRFCVPTGVVLAKFGLAAVLLALSLAFGSRDQVVIGVVAAAAVVGYAARDLLARDRLRADASGLIAVYGYLSRARLEWSEVERLTVDSRLRLGIRTETLEVDAGERIFLYGRLDLGVPPGDALAALESLRPT